MHAEMRVHFGKMMESSNGAYSSHLRGPEEYYEVTLQKCIDGEVQEINLGNVSFSNENRRQKNKAPLYLDHMSLPGEGSAIVDAV